MTEYQKNSHKSSNFSLEFEGTMPLRTIRQELLRRKNTASIIKMGDNLLPLQGSSLFVIEKIIFQQNIPLILSLKPIFSDSFFISIFETQKDYNPLKEVRSFRS